MNSASPLVELRGHTFYPGLLPADAVVVDAGGNRGDFTREIAALGSCQVVVMEPVPELFAVIPDARHVRKLNRALGAEAQRCVFHVGRNPEANSMRPLRPEELAATIEVEVTTLSDLMVSECLEQIDLLKLDIEGAEIDVLLHAPEALLAQIGQITAEFHAHTVELARSPAEELKRIHAVVERLESLGFICLNRSAPFFIDVLFVNRERAGWSRSRAAWERVVHEQGYRLVNSVRRRLFSTPPAPPAS